METQKNEVDNSKYLLIHTIDTLTRSYQAFVFNKQDEKAKEVADKISELVKKI